MSRFFYLLLAVFAVPAHAAGVAHPANFYEMALNAVHIDKMWVPTLGSLVVTLVLILMGLKYRASVAAAGDNVVPEGKFNLRFLIDTIFDISYSLTKENCGHHYRNYLPFMATLFFFILVANLSGLIPNLPPPTVTMEMNVAMGLCVFVVYNYAGAKEAGFGYIKHFFGPVAFIAPLFFAIELISHGSRPLSLGLRLMGNIYGDHTLLGVFTSLTYLGFPSLLMFFGLLVAVVQSFVFTLLTGIYISLATAHDH